jgi:hypothetical protein
MLRVSTADYALNGRLLPSSEISRHVWLNLIPKNGHPQSTLFIELPSHQVTYRSPGESAMRMVPFTQDAILDWMQQQCGLDAGVGQVRAEAGAMYSLLSRLDAVRPATVKHFDEIAVASLSCFRPQGSSETPERRWYHGTALKPGEQIVFAALVACLIAAWLLLGRSKTQTIPESGNPAQVKIHPLEPNGSSVSISAESAPQLDTYLGKTPLASVFVGWAFAMIVVWNAGPILFFGVLASGLLAISALGLYAYRNWERACDAYHAGSGGLPPRVDAPKKLRGIPLWVLAVATAVLGFVAVYLPKPGDLPEPPRVETIFKPYLLVTPENDSYRFVGYENGEWKKHSPVFNVNRMVIARQEVTRTF